MQTICVTGAGGYIGSVLCGYLLNNGYKVLAVDNFYYKNQQGVFQYIGTPGFSLINTNVVNVKDFYSKEISCFVPLAAIVGAPACDVFPHYSIKTNYQAIVDLVRQLSPEQRLIFMNTNSGYGATDGDVPCKETDKLTPISHYGKTKCDAEVNVLEHTRSVVFRLATVFGASPRMRFDLLVNDFTEKLITEGRLVLFEPNFKRSLVHVRDVCRSILFAISHQRMRGVYNVSALSLTKQELAERICEEIGISKFSVIQGLGEDPDKRNYQVCTDKILEAGFRFAYSLEDGIREVAKICSLTTKEERRKMRNA